MLGCNTLSPKRNVGVQNLKPLKGVLGCKTPNSAEILVFSCYSLQKWHSSSRHQPPTKKKNGHQKKKGAKKTPPHNNCLLFLLNKPLAVSKCLGFCCAKSHRARMVTPRLFMASVMIVMCSDTSCLFSLLHLRGHVKHRVTATY